MAHARRSFRGRGISDSQRRKKSWVQITGPLVNINGVAADPDIQTPNLVLDLPQTLATTNPEGQSIGLFSDPTLDKVPPESTILRVRGSLNLPKNTVESIENHNFAFGIGVMEATAAALGAFPNPATPEGGAWDGWMFYRSQQQGALDANAGIFDVKSMRKVQSGSSIVVVFGEYWGTTDLSLASADGGQATFNMRALILLP